MVIPGVSKPSLSRYLAPMLLIALVIAPTLPATAAGAATVDSNPVPQFLVERAYSSSLLYLSSLERSVMTPIGPKYKVISEYPSLPVWAIYGYDPDIRWVPGVIIEKNCTYSMPGFLVKLSDIQETHTSTKSVFKYEYKFMLREVAPYTGQPVDLEVATIEVTETQYSNESYSISIKGVSYQTLHLGDGCPDANGQYIDVWFGPSYVGSVGELISQPWEASFNNPWPSFRASLRHVQVLGDLFYQAIGDSQSKLHAFVDDALAEIFGYSVTPFDLYGNALAGYSVNMQVKDVVDIQFYDAHWFGDTLGYTKLYNWMKEHGYVDGSYAGVSYPLYPYKSKVVSVAELTHSNGGSEYIEASTTLVKNYCRSTGKPHPDEDPLYNEWKGLYYAVVGQWSQALAQWNDVVDNWDGYGVKTCFSNGYSSVRLAGAIMLGVKLAKQGMIPWDTVDAMVHVLLQTQWLGHGWYKPTGGNWVKIYKNDHKWGFLVSYNVAPDGSIGFAPFRPTIFDIVLSANDMDPEYAGPILTNAEVTLTATAALKLYLDARYTGNPTPPPTGLGMGS